VYSCFSGNCPQKMWVLLCHSSLNCYFLFMLYFTICMLIFIHRVTRYSIVQRDKSFVVTDIFQASHPPGKTGTSLNLKVVRDNSENVFVSLRVTMHIVWRKIGISSSNVAVSETIISLDFECSRMSAVRASLFTQEYSYHTCDGYINIG